MKNIISTKNAPSAIGPYSQAVCFGDMMITSGQLGLVPETGEFKEGGVEAQARQALENVKAIIEEAGLTMDNVVKTTVFMKDMDDFAKVNAIYAEFFTEGNYPARSAVEVAALPKGGLVEIEVIASK